MSYSSAQYQIQFRWFNDKIVKSEPVKIHSPPTIIIARCQTPTPTLTLNARKKTRIHVSNNPNKKQHANADIEKPIRKPPQIEKQKRDFQNVGDRKHSKKEKGKDIAVSSKMIT